MSQLIMDESHIIESSSLSESTKVGQVYCYLSSGPVPMLKIGKGKNGRQRMASWIQEYPPSWRDGNVVFILDKKNQSTAESAFHKFFKESRVTPESMRSHLGIEDWQRLPDGASEWFYCSTHVKDSFRSVSIDLVNLYTNRDEEGVEEDVEEQRELTDIELRVSYFFYRANRMFRGLLGWTTLGITTIMSVGLWGSWIPFALVVLFGIYISRIIFP